MHEPITIHLSRKEVMAAIDVGVKGHLDVIGDKYQQVRAGSITSWDLPINESLASAAVKKWLNGRSDVIARSALRDYGNLIVNELDPPEGIICLVSCLPPQFKIHGYIRVQEARAVDDALKHTEAGKRWWIGKDKLRDPRELGNE